MGGVGAPQLARAVRVSVTGSKAADTCRFITLADEPPVAPIRNAVSERT